MSYVGLSALTPRTMASVPLTTSVPVTTPVFIPMPVDEPYAMRITVVDLKHGGEQIMKSAFHENYEMLEDLDNLKGRQQLTAFFMDEASGKTHNTHKMVVTALYDSTENLEAGL